MAICRMSESPFPSQNQDKFVLRLPDGMRDRIKTAAEANNRSMNAEIVAALEEKFPKPLGAVEDRIRHLADELLAIAKEIAANPLDGAHRTALAIHQQAIVAELHQIQERMKRRGE